ncbi:unnamed protein product [Caenorhabditis brenneri]
MSSTPLPTVTLSPTVSLAWEHCSQLGHEMIVTTHGRRIFPCLEYTLDGLDPQKLYSMSVHLEFVDNKRLRYLNGQFVESESTEKKDPPRRVFHPCGVQNGEKWMSRNVDFNHIRITNRKSMEEKSTSYVHLHTQHRYMPVLTIYEEDKPYYIACVPNTVFHTVTGYHSEILDKYKTSLNPFATGSRPERVEKRKGGAKGATYGTPKRFKAAKRDADTDMFQKMYREMLGKTLPPLPPLPPIQVPKMDPSPPEPLEVPKSEPCTSPVVPEFSEYPENLPKMAQSPSKPDQKPQDIGAPLAPPLQDLATPLSNFFLQYPMFPMTFNPFLPTLTPCFNPFVPNIFPTPSVSPSSDSGSCPQVPGTNEDDEQEVDVVC